MSEYSTPTQFIDLAEQQIKVASKKFNCTDEREFLIIFYKELLDEYYV